MNTTGGPVLENFLTNEQFLTSLTVFTSLYALFVCIGIVNNVISTWAFIAMGLQDCVTCSLFVLSVSDLGMVLTGAVFTGSNLMEVLERRGTHFFFIEPGSISITSSFLREQFLLLSSLTTTFLAVTRCACVTMPLKFRYMFTRRRAVIALAVFACFSFLNLLPLVAGMRLKTISVNNGTFSRRIFTLGPNYFQLSEIMDVLLDMITNFSTQILTLISLVVICIALKRTSRFRNKSSNASFGTPGHSKSGPATGSTIDSTLNSELTRKASLSAGVDSSATRETDSRHGTTTESWRNMTVKIRPEGETMPQTFGTQPIADMTAQGKKMATQEMKGTLNDQPLSTMSKRELQAIKQVAILSAVYVLTNLPRMVMMVVRALEPEFYIKRKYEQAFQFSMSIRITAELFCAATNIFIYVTFNSKYRTLLRKACCHRETDG